MSTVTVKQAIERAGGPSAVAAALGIDRSTPYSWRRVPAHHAAALAALAGIEPHDLRPDVFPAPDASR